MARRYAANGTPSGGEFQVNTTELGYQYTPDSAYVGDGSAIVVWTSYGQDGSNGGVYGQRLDPAGAKLGPEFNVNTYTTGFQGRAAVAASDAGEGDFAIIWQSAGQDGSNLGGRGRSTSTPPAGASASSSRSTRSRPDSRALPHMTAQPNGQYVAVWDSAEPTGRPAASPRGWRASRAWSRRWSTRLTPSVRRRRAART